MQRHVQLIRELIHPRAPLNFDRHEPKPKTALHPKPLNPKPKPLHTKPCTLQLYGLNLKLNPTP